MSKLIEAIRAQQSYKETRKKKPPPPTDGPFKTPKLPDHLIIKILIEQYKGRRGSSIAKSLDLPPNTVYNIMRRYLFQRSEDGNHTYVKNPNAD